MIDGSMASMISLPKFKANKELPSSLFTKPTGRSCGTRPMHRQKSVIWTIGTSSWTTRSLQDKWSMSQVGSYWIEKQQQQQQKQANLLLIPRAFDHVFEDVGDEATGWHAQLVFGIVQRRGAQRTRLVAVQRCCWVYFMLLCGCFCSRGSSKLANIDFSLVVFCYLSCKANWNDANCTFRYCS